MKVSLKSSQANVFSRPHSCPSHPCWKLLSSRFCLPPCSSQKCTATYRCPGPLGWLLSVLAGRRLLPPDLHQERNEAVLGWHETWHPCYRRGETKSRAIAGLHVCPAILRPCTLLGHGAEPLRLWGQSSGLGSPVPHTAQAAIPHSCLGGQNRQLAAQVICPLGLHFIWPC